MAKVREIEYRGEKFFVADSDNCELLVKDQHGAEWKVVRSGESYNPFSVLALTGGHWTFATVEEAVHTACQQLRDKQRLQRVTPEDACDAMHRYVEVG